MNKTTGYQLLFTAVVIGAAILLRYVVVGAVRLVTGEQPNERVVFWARQAASVVASVLAVAGLLSIWFKDTGHLTTAAGLIGAGIAFAMQKVVTAFAGHLVILRGKTFTVGDRITMGGVRGDVISLGFLQTRIMEMGEPGDAQSGDNPTWVFARQFTGRVVTVTNDKVFDDPVYNYTREFPYIWDETRIPVTFKADRKRAESILVECADEVTAPIVTEAEGRRDAFERRYFIDVGSLKPRVFWQITDNWVRCTCGFSRGPTASESSRTSCRG